MKFWRWCKGVNERSYYSWNLHYLQWYYEQFQDCHMTYVYFLKCLESSTISKESPNCPTCWIEFQIPQGWLRDLKKNEFIEQLNNIGRSSLTCLTWKENQTIEFCVECSYNYCLTCLVLHRKIPSMSIHQLQPVTSVKEKFNTNKYAICDEHLEMMTLLCNDLTILIDQLTETDRYFYWWCHEKSGHSEFRK